MKLAISGKGGVGKTTLAALLAIYFRDREYKVLAVDADPDANLAATLGFPHPDGITPIAEMRELIAERMGVDDLDSFGSFFRMNPKVDDIPERFCTEHDGIRLIVMGGVKKGGTGCTCPENTFLRRLMAHLLLEEKDVVIMDMEAGIEHLGRGTADSVDLFLVVVEPGMRSVETAHKVARLAKDIGIKKVAAVGNKIMGDEDRKLIESKIAPLDALGFLPYHPTVHGLDRGLPVDQVAPEVLEEVEHIGEGIERFVRGSKFSSYDT